MLGNAPVLQLELALRQLATRREQEKKRLGYPLYFRALMGSSNDEARAQAEKGAPHGSLVIAGQQSAGRGRRGRNWESPEGGNLYFSLILRPKIPSSRAYEFTLLAGVAVADALAELGFDARLKWPNDVEVAGKKVAGILCELSTDSKASIAHVVMGIGINVNAPLSSFDPEVVQRATSLKGHAGAEIPLPKVVDALLDALEEWTKIHENKGLDPILKHWRRFSSTLGQAVAVSVEGERLEGVAEDLDPSGALLIRCLNGKLERISAGEVLSLRRS